MSKYISKYLFTPCRVFLITRFKNLDFILMCAFTITSFSLEGSPTFLTEAPLYMNFYNITCFRP